MHLDNGITSLSGPCFYNLKIYQKVISTFYIQLIQVIHNINLYIHCKTVEYIQASSLQILYRTTLNMKIEKINLKERNSNFQIPAKYKTSNSSGWCVPHQKSCSCRHFQDFINFPFLSKAKYIIGMARLCSATFEQLFTFRATFYFSSNFFQFEQHEATFSFLSQFSATSTSFSAIYFCAHSVSVQRNKRWAQAQLNIYAICCK